MRSRTPPAVGDAADMWRDGFELSAAAGGPVHVRVLAAAVGVRPEAVRARAAREGWWHPYPDIVGPPGTPDTPRTRALAALAQVRGGDPDDPRPAALHRWSGAAAWGVHGAWPTAVQLVLPASRTYAGDRLEVVRSRGYRESAVVVREGCRVVDAPWLVRSLAAVAEVPRLTDAVIDLVQARHTDLDRVTADHERLRRYPGRATAAEALARLGAAGRTDSSFERRMRERLVAAGIPLDVGQVEVPCAGGVTIHLDHGNAAIRFGIEDVSMKAHSQRHQLRADARRANALAAVEDDWRVLQATWEDLGTGWDTFIVLVREVVGIQSRRHLGVPWPRPDDRRSA